MKNSSFLEQVKCIIKHDCDNLKDQENEVREEETQTETMTQGFHPFDIDEVFAN